MNLVDLYCFVDDFNKVFLPFWYQKLINSGEKQRRRPGRMTESEIMTILIHFHQSHFRDFKAYYLCYVCVTLKSAFPQLLSYTRFVALIPTVLIPLCAYLQTRKVTTTGISFVDATSLIVCQNKRIYGHKVFKEFAALGKTTKGWFYGFKLHLICNHEGELVNCMISPGNTDDRVPLPVLTKNMWGKLFGDKGYISQAIFEQLLTQGLPLVTGIKRNMKNKLLPLFDKLVLRKRARIESVNNQLKNVFQVEHTRHRGVLNGLVNIISALLAYTHHPHKPSIKLTQQEHAMIKNLAA